MAAQQIMPCEHLFLQCPDAWRIWKRLGWDHVPYLESTNAIWHTPELQERHTDKSTSTVATAILWNIWKASNSLVFQRHHYSTTQVIRAVASSFGPFATETKTQ
ncbi:hypothetical protein C2845_PM02G01170 [Panicum miliaceum]|uniref:Uncharacterized protein n=1 Tax=Panicum miliaceum TaxID=4540 RepID=A0A3L6SB85_PANMI|nr:hypothetical protein C2845_PM02G01170 [Panicum miliaceum]